MKTPKGGPQLQLQPSRQQPRVACAHPTSVPRLRHWLTREDRAKLVAWVTGPTSSIFTGTSAYPADWRLRPVPAHARRTSGSLQCVASGLRRCLSLVGALRKCASFGDA